MISRSVSESHLAGPWYSAPINFSNTLSFFEVGAAAIGMVFTFRKTLVHSYTGSVLGLDAAIVAMLGHASGCEYVGGKVGSEARRGAWDARKGCGVVFFAACFLGLCLSMAAAATSESKINMRGVTVVGKVNVWGVFPATVLHTSRVRSTTCRWSWSLFYICRSTI